MLLNLDAGESPAESPELWALADILCVACGGHTGDTSSMERVVRFCADRRRAGHPGPRLGAHPSYPDRANFGRVSRLPSTDYERQTLYNDLVRQCTDLVGIGAQWNVQVELVKPHGALYHDANANPALARVIVDVLTEVVQRVAERTRQDAAISLIGPPTGQLHDTFAPAAAMVRNVIGPAALNLMKPAFDVMRPTVQPVMDRFDDTYGRGYLREAFADRRVRADGSLVPRSEPDALITDPAEAAARAREIMATRAADTICCHADTPNALEIVTAVRAAIPR
jgi:5-oxoprolinase (ATP-hydrolysing) subunit A